MIKRIIAASVLALMLILSGGCGHTEDSTNSNTVTVLCAAFAEYDWTRNILGENPGNVDLQLLNASGMDMHSYQPSVADMVKIADADLVVYTGGESEFWIEDALESSAADAADRQSLSMMEVFEHNHELADRYSSDGDEDHNHDHDYGHGHETAGDEASHESHIHSTDEHLWLSPVMASAFITEITEAICVLDPHNEDYYRSNASSYTEKIRQLNDSFKEVADAAGYNTILFADRYPFKYLLEDYGLRHVAAFPGCSAETEASFETILNLSETMDNMALDSVIILHKSSPDLARTVISNSGHPDAEILILNSMQSVTAKDIECGASWISIMNENLASLRQALD